MFWQMGSWIEAELRRCGPSTQLMSIGFSLGGHAPTPCPALWIVNAATNNPTDLRCCTVLYRTLLAHRRGPDVPPLVLFDFLKLCWTCWACWTTRGRAWPKSKFSGDFKLHPGKSLD